MKKIQKTICREELRSRIPGLFAYIEENDAGEFKLHKATDSLQGCYGKIVEDIKLPTHIDGNDNVLSVNLKVNNEYILKEGETYSYRTLMNYYYEYKNYEFTDDDDCSFISFIDIAIGKIEIDLDSLGLNGENNDLVPHYIYLANARKLFNQYSKLKIVYDYYTGGYIEHDGKLVPSEFDINVLEGDICCLCTKYVRMGGTVMYNKLETLISQSETTAEVYYSFAQKDNLTLKLNVQISQSIHDTGYLSCYLNEWVGGDEHFSGELYTYNARTYMCINNNHDRYNNETMQFEFDDSKFIAIPQIKADPNGGADYKLEGHSDSKLRSLRRFKEYINGEDKEESPDENEDWLYYYREGVIINYTTVNDWLGNIADVDKLQEGELKAATNIDKLAAYGNVIKSITANQQDRTITFVYYLNVHLKANSVVQKYDDDGNVLYLFDGFYVDESDLYHGIKYTETYNYEKDGELDKLVSGNIEGITFSEYVSDAKKNYVDFNKYPFSVMDSIVYYDKRLDTQIVSIPYIKNDYEVLIKNETDYLFANVFKTDYYEGITYKPIIEKNVNIKRGNYAAFEKHLKLAEVKTMEDMENFSNNSFFNVQK